MPFEFLKGKDKSKAPPAAEGPAKGAKTAAGKGKSFAEGESARAPEKEKSKGKGALLKSGMHAIADALRGANPLNRPLDERRAAGLNAFMNQALVVRGQAENIAIHVKILNSTVPADLMASNAVGMAKANVALGHANKMMSLYPKLEAASSRFMKDGDSTKFNKVLMEFVRVGTELQKAVLGHTGPGDHLTPESFLLSPFDSVVGGRTLTSQETANKTDNRKGEKTDVDGGAMVPNLAMQGGMDFQALRNYASYYAAHFGTMTDLAVSVL